MQNIIFIYVYIIQTKMLIHLNIIQNTTFMYINIWYLYSRTASVVWWSEFQATDPEVRVRFPALPDFLRSSGSETGYTQSCEDN
jgi:hypothetical protein